MKQVSHHIKKRERNSNKELHPYPAKDPYIAWLDKVVLIVAVLVPFMTIPQVYNVWFLKVADGVSPITWGLYLLFAFPFLAYGIVHKDKPIIIMNLLWIVFDGLMFIGALIY